MTEDIGRYLYIRWKILSEVLQRSFQFVGQLQSTGGGLFGDGHQYGRFPSFRSRSQFGGFRSDPDISDILQQYRYAVDTLYYRFTQLFYVCGGEYTTHNVFVTIFIKYTSVGIQVHAAGDGHHLIHRYAIMTHTFRIELNLIFF